MGLTSRHSASATFVMNRVPVFYELLRKSVYSFRLRVICSQNTLLTNISVIGICVSNVVKTWDKRLFIR